jgi:fructoselysine-6-P-deglycase FrlB-like protein
MPLTDDTTPPLFGDVSFVDALAGQAAALAAVIPALADDVRAQQAGGAFAGAGPVFVGIGASHATAASPVWVLRARGIDAWRLSAGDQPLPFPASDHPIVGISQSGKSTETLAVLQSVGADRRYAVVNSSPSPITAVAARHLSLGNVPDSYASTIGFTATVAALGMIADAWDGGTIGTDWDVLPSRFAALEAALAFQIQPLADLFDGATSADFVGAAASAGTAEVAALLFREVVRLPSMGTTTRQYLHGQMESAGGGVHVLFGDEREADIARSLSAVGHRVILVTTLDTDPPGSVHTVRLPDVAPPQRTILETLVMQTLVKSVAEARGLPIEEFVFFNSDTKVEGAGP